MVFIKKLNDWMDRNGLSESEKDKFVGYAIRAAFARHRIVDFADKEVVSFFSKIQNSESYHELETIIEECFNINAEPEADDNECEVH